MWPVFYLIDFEFCEWRKVPRDTEDLNSLDNGFGVPFDLFKSVIIWEKVQKCDQFKPIFAWWFEFCECTKVEIQSVSGI